MYKKMGRCKAQGGRDRGRGEQQRTVETSIVAFLLADANVQNDRNDHRAGILETPQYSIHPTRTTQSSFGNGLSLTLLIHISYTENSTDYSSLRLLVTQRRVADGNYISKRLVHI